MDEVEVEVKISDRISHPSFSLCNIYRSEVVNSPSILDIANHSNAAHSFAFQIDMVSSFSPQPRQKESSWVGQNAVRLPKVAV